MLPEMFWSANDCACRPETAVFRASKIPIPFLQLRSGRPADPGKRGRNRGRVSQGPCQNIKFNYIKYLRKNPVRGPGPKLPGRATIAALKAPCGSGCGGGRRFEDKAKPVDAIAQAGGLRAVVEDVAEMAAAAAAMHLDPRHAVGAVLGAAERVVERLEEARPARAALELGVRGKQRQIAAGAGESTLAMLLHERARPRTLRAVLAQAIVLLRRQL